MNVIEGTYRICLYDFITRYGKIIRKLNYSMDEAQDCVEFLQNGVLQYLKILVINDKLHSCCKMVAIARDYMDNKFADKTGRFFKDLSDNERFFLAHCIQFDYMKCSSSDDSKVDRLVDLIGFVK